ncbi:hypothetical protein EYZ11_009444 [Aspergillus tanneri]|uniref:Uncharacterized protein n=1 Tax=Aspergillus tanneri TaxID=1220188 RepID=A0A4S3J837_9EURO|nr:uncharacterized protein ATNIH1004_005979 [Aspergillus tanneri]KAA8647289.1 hypothetical protein ATNIH1004_005979 [Aspergillus tanneri]THC91100.1 hypothetical protein EYZ11_009444 [Aspergillus tanneri]
MSDPPKRIVLEKSRTVRRRYQRSNKRLQFTASQIARIEREEERERRAEKLREREKKRIANKKKKAEKEATAREERRRLGLPEQDAPPVPASQPLLSRFLKKTTDSAPANQESSCEYTELDSPGASATEEDKDRISDLDNDASDGTIVPDLENILVEGKGFIEYASVGNDQGRVKDDDEFSDCSIFYDEDVIKEAETIVTALDAKVQPEAEKQLDRTTMIGLSRGDSFRDDTADLLEQFAHEFDMDEEFERN